MQLSPATNMLWAVLVKAGKNMTYFLLMFLILILGFGLMGEQMLGTYLEGYSNIIRCTITRFTVLTLTLTLSLTLTLTRCMITLFTVLMGDFDVDEFTMANPTFGIIFFIVP